MEVKLFTRRPEREVKLHPNETVISMMHRHIVHLLVRLVAPGLLFVLSAAVAVFRAVGGEFFVGDAVPPGQIGVFEIGLVGAAALLALGACLIRRTRGASIALGATAITALAWLLFRLRGGRVLTVSPYGGQVADPGNVLLFIIAAISGLICVYLYLDWKTDEFILTSQRIIYNNERPLVRREQEQLPLINIQQVEASTDTYLRHWLRLGTLQIKSAAVGFTIFFDDAYDPDEMQRKIMDQVKKVRRDETNADLRRLIESALGGAPSEPVSRAIEVERTVAPGLLQWLFPVNPEIDHERHIYTWRPHWFFLVRAIWLPTALWLALASVSILAMMGGLAGGLISAGALLAGSLVFSTWAAWQVEDHRNDRYILTPTQVVDVNKKPFGPENRRTANLEALQNVTYRTTLLGRIFGYGDVLLQTAGAGDDFTFFDAPRPGQMVDVITNYQVAYKRSSKLRSLEDTVKLIQFYDAHYRAQKPSQAREVGGSSR